MENEMPNGNEEKMMKPIGATQIEANVIIILYNADMKAGEVHPYWECEMPMEDLVRLAVGLANAFTEALGGGSTRFEIEDFRKNSPS